MASSKFKIPCKAIVSYSEHDWRLEDVFVREPEENEVLVQIDSTGVCHSDVKNVGNIYPRILGHEGAGTVIQVHPSVRRCEVGDPVLLSYPRCDQCRACHTGHPAHCHQNGELTIFARDPNYMLAHGEEETLSDDGQGRNCIIPAGYFGQSSFSSIALVKESSIINAKTLIENRDELGVFAPLGCGLQTGAGVITNIAKPVSTDTVAVIGLGAVGLAAVAASLVRGVKTIIGIDILNSRLDRAADFGITHTINSKILPSGQSLAAAIQALPMFDQSKPLSPVGPSVIVDTTGSPAVMQEALKAVGKLGQVVQVTSLGADASISIGLPAHMRSGASFTGTVQGDADPYQIIPELVRWYRNDRLLLEKMEKQYPITAFQDALKELHEGSVIKAVLRW